MIQKIKVLAYFGMLVFLVRIIGWMGPENIRNKTVETGKHAMQQLVLTVMYRSDVQMAYLSGKEGNVVQKIFEDAKKSNTVYRYLEDTCPEEKLIRYEPDGQEGRKEEKESTSSLFFAQEEAEEENTTVTQEDGQPQAETEQTLGEAEPQEMQKEEEKGEVAVYAPAFSLAQLRDFDFLKSSLYIVPARASVLPEDLNVDTLLAKDMRIEKKPELPQILIYHTHGSETFADSTEDLMGTGIIAAGSRLAQVLSETYGYNVIHCTEIFDNVNGVFDRSKAYDYSRAAVQQILTDNPGIEVMIDLHRDGVREDLHLVTEIDGKQTAQIMFFNGVSRSRAKGDLAYLYNRYRSENLSFSLQAKLEAMCRYPDFTRKNYIDAYQYNLDLMPRAMLIEAGAQTNTLSEELNAMEYLAEILDSVLTGDSRMHLGLE